MIGTVTTWVAPTLTINCTSFGGGNATDWHICRNDGIDIAVYRVSTSKLPVARVPVRAAQSSDVGDPLSVTATAQLFGVSEDIRGLASVRGEVLVVAHSSGVSLIYGSAATAEKKFHSTDANIAIGSLFEIAGTPSTQATTASSRSLGRRASATSTHRPCPGRHSRPSTR